MAFVILTAFSATYFLLCMIVASILRKTFTKWARFTYSHWPYRIIFTLNCVPSLWLFLDNMMTAQMQYAEYGVLEER